MCGFSGIFSVDGLSQSLPDSSLEHICHRGPDQSGSFSDEYCSMIHARLSILDPTERGRQPLTDQSGRYVMSYNGEIYNYKELRKDLILSGVRFQSNTDTEVVVNLFAQEGIDCLKKLNGCFAAAIYDTRERTVTLIRDRFGINPLLYSTKKGNLFFSSEMSGLMHLPIDRKIDYESLGMYLELNYIPQPWTILKDVYKLEPGTYAVFDRDGIKTERYYEIPAIDGFLSYRDAVEKGRSLLEQSVTDRLIADVPVGSFLSGGLDSSIVAMLAARHHSSLHTFSVGYKDEPMYDETRYALEVAKHIGSDHTVFEFSNSEMLDTLDPFLNSIDEPFADSSALAVFMLSRKTREQVKVALSGDGADEMFGGYLKHRAHYSVVSGGLKSRIARLGAPAWNVLPKSRSSKLSDVVRKLDKFTKGARLDPADRYWEWASILSSEDAKKLLLTNINSSRKEAYTAGLANDLDSVLRADMNLVLAGDMLRKVDSMSMANSLEVRVPFLDHRVVEFAFSLPDRYKIHGKKGKRILHDMFRDELPASIYDRKKHGFEVPLNRWMNTDLKERIDREWLNEERIDDEGLFSSTEIKKLKKKAGSKNPGDAAATLWALIIFEHWRSNYSIEL